MLTSIANSKNNSAELLLNGLGIDHVGAKAARLIVEKYKDLEKISNLTVPELITIDTIGETIAESMVTYFNQPSAQKLLQELKDSNVNMKFLGISDQEAPENFFKDKKVVLTGKLEHFTRNEFTKKLQILGATVTGSVSKKTDYLIYGSDAGSKKIKAEKLEVPMLTETEAIAKINE